MANPAPITIESVIRAFKGLPHQLAALPIMEEDIKTNGYEVAMRRDRSWFAVWSQSGKQDLTTGPYTWVPLALRFIEFWEKCSLTAYIDVAKVPTIGWGSTRMPNRLPVKMGDVISQIEADRLLYSQVVHEFGDTVARQIKPWAALIDPVKAAIVSWAFNNGTGIGGSEDSTLVRRLNEGETPLTVLTTELPRWNKGMIGGKLEVVEGLVNRRMGEVRLARGEWDQPLSGLARMETPKLSLVAQQPPKAHLSLTRTASLDGNGLTKLRLQIVVDGVAKDNIYVVSGARGAQAFRKGVDSISGSYEPLPEGRWRLTPTAWASGRVDDWSGSWGAGLGPVSISIEYEAPGTTQRSAIEIHIDWNGRTSPGTAGCIGVANQADYRKLLEWIKTSKPSHLFADWGLGSCPKP